MAKDRRLFEAYSDPGFPCNPRPFALGLNDYVRENGSDSIKSDDAKRVLWVLMAQAYGESATIDLHNEWNRLYKLDNPPDPKDSRPILSGATINLR